MTETVDIYADEERPKRVGGQVAGLHIPDAVFFDPLPEEELALWEGASASDEPL